MIDLTLVQILALIVGAIELVIRVIPSVNNWSPLAIILKILTAISEFLNRKSQKK